MSDIAPMLVAYRNGFTDPKGVTLPWMSATPSTSMTLMIDGAYSVTVVCMVGGKVLTWQASHTVKDDRDPNDDKSLPTLHTPCSDPPRTSAVNVTLVQDGRVHLGDADGTATQADPRSFTLQVPDGTYDLIASDPGDKKALIKRDVAVTGPDPTEVGSIDVNASGVGLTALPSMTSTPPVPGLSLDNPPKASTGPTDTTNTETVEARVVVQTANNAAPGPVFFAPYDLVNKKVSAFAYPTAMLTADDVQSATFIGSNTLTPIDTTDPTKKRKTTVTTTRLQTRPLDDDAMAGKTTFQLPSAIKGPGWGLDTPTQLSVALPSLPALDDLTLTTSGLATNGTTQVVYQIHITANFFNDTSMARPLFDTNLPSPSTASQIDFTKGYMRDIVSQHDVTDDDDNVIGHETSMFHEVVPMHTGL